MLNLIPVLIAMASSIQAPTQRPEILVLGTYHMANPGRDLHNVQADDVRSPKRQKEIEELVQVLERFHPTRIAVEEEIGSDRLAKEYADYLAGKYELTRNETDQIAYRLGKKLGLKQIDAVDEGMDFPWQRVLNYAKANGRSKELDEVSAGWGKLAKEQGDFMASHTVLETLEYLNSDEHVAQDVGLYYAIVRMGDPADPAGQDLLAAWYKRNIHIYHNIRSLVDSPTDRILVVYGAGHLGWLRQDIANDPSVQLRKLSDLVGQK
ncbi:MAG TPA: DUF5694 domain-containing protein [Fimbriimonadaceae bacterium]|nr:DUF5694 domain-containing protein [Fimbriimonadaceae bacterium]